MNDQDDDVPESDQPPFTIDVLSLMEDVPDSMESPIRAAVHKILLDANCSAADVSVTILSDEAIHEANQRYLNHNYPTDVLSFRLDGEEDDADADTAGDLPGGGRPIRRLEGEILVSWETAVRESQRYGWSAADECLLYVVHGCLHLVGHDDHDPQCKSVMRQAEREVLRDFGLTPPYDEVASDQGAQDDTAVKETPEGGSCGRQEAES